MSNLRALQSQIALGEDSKRQFKENVRNAESLAAEMAAFANSEGGMILIGVADDGAKPGLATADVSRINQLISNAASQLVRSPLTVQTENVPLGDAPGNAPLKEGDAPETERLKGHMSHLSGQSDPINDLLNEIREAPHADYVNLARTLQVIEATVKRNIQKLKQQNRVRRVGSKKTGHWEVIE